MTAAFAFVFPGQGSQSLTMLHALAADFSCVVDTFAQASEVLGYDLWEVVQNGPEARLNQTEITQPAMLAADVAVYRCWEMATKLQPKLMAGHSLGEYAALVVAKALAFTDAVRLVAQRGAYMQQAVSAGVGAMAAIVGLNDRQVIALCHQAAQGEVVVPANFNSIGQIVISGEKPAVMRAIALAQSLGAKIAKQIPVSVPSHSPLMQSAQEKLAVNLAQTSFNVPQILVVHNAHVATEVQPARIRQVLLEQLTGPVRWVETIQKMHQEGVSCFVECGPGKVLTGLIKRIERSVVTANIETPISLHETILRLQLEE